MMLTHEQLADLRRLANKAVPSAEWFLSKHLNEVPFIDGAAAKFIVAANPEAILHMLHHIDAQQARIAELEQDAANAAAAELERIKAICGDVIDEWFNCSGGADEVLRRIEEYEQKGGAAC